MLTPEQVELLKTTIAKGLSDLELQLFLNVCDRTGLDPFARQICPVLRWDKKANKNVMSIQVQIDGYRQIAQNTGEYAGCDRPLFDEGLTLYEHQKAGRKHPETCMVTVYRLVKGVRCPFTAEVAWSDFYPGDTLGFMWKSKPYLMLGKSCEGQALRKAFQAELKLLATEEEIAIDTIEPSPKQIKQSDDWFEMQAELRTAKTVEEVNAIAQTAQSRMPMNGNRYALDKELEIARERIQMSPPAPVVVAEPPKPPAVIVPSVADKKRLEALCLMTGAPWDTIARLCKDWLKKSEHALTSEDIPKLRGLIFWEYATIQYELELNPTIELWKSFFIGAVTELDDRELFDKWKAYLSKNDW